MRPINQLRNPLSRHLYGRWVELVVRTPGGLDTFPGARWIRPTPPSTTGRPQ